jgi:hypothetical protein
MNPDPLQGKILGMNLAESWEIDFQSEIENATKARESGNEGMARVCARRAAGIIVGEYFQRIHIDPGTNSAYERIRILRDLHNLPAEARQISDYLLLRITPEHTLPIKVDLLAEVIRLKQILLEDR